MLMGQTLQSSVKIADQFFAISLGRGEVTVLSYTRKIIVLIDGLFGIAIGRSLLPVLAESHAHKGAATHIARQWILGTFVMGIAVAFVTFLGAEEITKFLFQRGSFHYSDTLRVANALKFALLQIPFYFSAIVFRYTLFSVRKYKAYLLIAALIMGSKLISEYILVSLLNTGIKGIFLSDIFIYISWIAGGFLALFYNRKEGVE